MGVDPFPDNASTESQARPGPGVALCARLYNPRMSDLITVAADGLYCSEGDFHVDPWRPVPRAVITHAHADHACRGSRVYLTTTDGLHVLRARMGAHAKIETIGYNATLDIRGVKLSLHPAGHVLGSAQVRLERLGRVEVVSGDYKTEPDQTCQSFEPVKCHRFITESTFGLPVYRWRPWEEEIGALNAWWRRNAEEGLVSVVFAYALGKAQRILAGLEESIGPIVTHGAVEGLVRAYRESGVHLPTTHMVSAFARGDASIRRALVLAPPSAQATPWLRRFTPARTAFASGWMRLRGARRRRAVDRGFVISDHADWPGLLAAIEATRAEEVRITHGYSAILARWLREHGKDADALPTRYEGERPDDAGEGDEALAEPSS